jgi:glycosyltransferase involved in cell wall biosynthesis
MNILLVMPWDLRIGGVVQVASTLGRNLEARGHSVSFLFPEDQAWRLRPRISASGFAAVGCRLRDYPPAPPTVRSHISWYSTVVAAFPQIVRHCRESGIALINVHYPMGSFALLADVSRRLGIPLVISGHGSDLLPDTGPSRESGLLRLLELADALVVPSSSYLGKVVEAFPGVRDRIRCIYNGYDAAEFAAVPATDHSADSQRVTILCIAALIHKKGIDVLLRALHACKDRRLVLRVIGQGMLQGELESLALTLGIHDRVTFMGPRDRPEVVTELRACDLLAMTSRQESESFGLATLEAMAVGKPVVASNIGGLRELVADGHTGFLVPHDNPPALAEALDRLAGDPELRARLGAAGRAKAQHFTVQQNALEYERLFQELSSGRRAPVPP